MTCFITCQSNGGFEDQLTVGERYEIKKRGDGELTIVNDHGEERTYGELHFNSRTCGSCK